MGTKKQATQLPKVYDPKAVEDKWYRYWKESGAFRADVDPDQERFSMVIPPPT